MRRFRLHLIIAAFLAFAIGVAVATDWSKVSPHFWKKINAEIMYDEQPSPFSTAYRSSNGDLLIIVVGQRYYMFFSSTQEIGTANPTNFYFLPGYAYSRNLPPPASPMDLVKHGKYGELVVGQRSIEFNSFEKGRVRVRW